MEKTVSKCNVFGENRIDLWEEAMAFFVAHRPEIEAHIAHEERLAQEAHV